MPDRTVKRNTRIFLSLLIAGGLFHHFQNVEPLIIDTVNYCLVYAVYAGLLLFWIQSVRTRLLPSRARSEMIAAAIFMLLFLLLRTFRYRIIYQVVSFRYSLYAYYVFLLFIPTFFFMSCAEITSSARGRLREGIVLVPALLLAALFLTNDLHGLVFRPLVPLQLMDGHEWTYATEPLFYSCFLWIFLSIFGGLFLLIRKTRQLRYRRSVLPLLFFPFLWTLLLSAYYLWVHRLPDIRPFYNIPEIHIFCMLGLFEACIRTRLMPHNSNYTGFFSRLSVPALITDEDLAPAYRTAVPFDASREMLSLAAEGSRDIYVRKDLRLHESRIRGGHVFWLDDESAIRSLNESLAEANETLSYENEILARENELIEEKMRIEERTRLYGEAAQAVYPVQKRISDLLAEAEPGTPSFRPAISLVLVLTAYIKRRSNFVMLRAERDTITQAELVSAMKEYAYYMAYRGLSCTVDAAGGQDLKNQEALDLYECFASASEVLSDLVSDLLVRLSGRDLLILCDLDAVPPLPPFPLRADARTEDGQLTLRFAAGGEPA